jgi:hypothetical protein
MIVMALLLQATAVPGLPESLVIPGPAPRFRHPTAPGVAIDMFRNVCLLHLRDKAGLTEAARRAGLRADPKSGADVGDLYRRGDLTLLYVAAGTLSPLQDRPICYVEAWLEGRIGEGAFERRFVAKVKPGSLTQRYPRIWERIDDEGRIEVIGLETHLHRHGQISALLSAYIGLGAPH